MGNKIDSDLKQQAEIFNKNWTKSDFRLSHNKLQSIQKLIIKEYPFLQTIHESMLVCYNKLEDCPIIMVKKKKIILFLFLIHLITNNTKLNSKTKR